MKKRLNAIYDLTVAPASFDFIVFLQLAEIYRLRHGYECLVVYILPGPKDGFRDDALHSPLPEREMMLRNIVLSAPHFLDSCQGVIWVKSREVLIASDSPFQDDVYPPGASLDRPQCHYIGNGLNAMYLLGERIRPFNAPAEFHNWALDFLSASSRGRPTVTINLRENPDFPSRNSDLAAWEQFCHYLVDKGYHPVVVRESSKSYSVDPVLSEFTHSPMATISLPFRLALYQNSHINMFVNNGPAALSLYALTNTIMMKLITEDNLSTSTPWWNANLGLGPDLQPPFLTARQKYVWRNDTFPNIKESFDEMVHTLESEPDTGPILNGIQNDEHLKLCLNSSLQYLLPKLCVQVTPEDILLFKRIQTLAPGFSLKNYIVSKFPSGSEILLDAIDKVASSVDIDLGI